MKIGTDCSGIEAPIQALQQLNIPHEHIFSSEINKFCIESIKANYNSKTIYTDIINRDSSALEDIDMYVCGFPCQPFSTAGNKLGSQDKRSNVMDVCIDVIKTKLPKVFILENVRNFKTIEKGKNYKYLLDELNSINKYNITPHIYNTSDYGLPQNRQRLYIVGILKECQTKQFEIPKPIQPKPIQSIIEPIHGNKQVTKNINNVLERYQHVIKQPGLHFIAPGSSSFGSCMINKSPCLTVSERIYIYEYKRNITPRESLALQGFSESFKQVTSDYQLYRQAGNSMSVCVLKAIITEILKSIKKYSL